MSFINSVPTNERSSVQVAIRVRPPNERETDAGAESITTVKDNTIYIANPEDKKKKSFSYDYAFDVNSTQEEVFDELGETIIDNAFKGYNCCIFAYGQTGCFAKDTPIMLIDGTYKAVQDITTEDIIMGDDSTPRRVQHLFTGIQDMYRVESELHGFDKYVVNKDHIMVFKDQSGQTVEMGIRDYVKLPPKAKKMYSCFTTAVDFPEIPINTDPYELGINIKEKEINIIPAAYKYNSRDVRTKLLNGLTNSTIGTLSQGVKIILDSEELAQDVLYICKSLGYNASLKKADNSYICNISNETSFVPIITKMNSERYYGFMLNGNHRFVGAGFNVLRNSGKSHSVMGSPDQPGMIPRVCQALYERQKTHNDMAQGDCEISYRIELSYLEIYSEEVKDLLRKDGRSSISGGLKVRQHPEYGPYVEGLTQLLVDDYKSIKRLIDQGNKERATAATLMNARSSRSHSILTIYFTQVIQERDLGKPREIVSKINLVDLAGSERVEASGVTGINFKEAININKSLSTLGLVISKLASKKVKPDSPVKTKAKAKISDPRKQSLTKKTSSAFRFNNQSPVSVTSRSPGQSPGSVKSKSPTEKKVQSVQDHIPFRDSVLTWILKESLGGNSKTIMLATVSPASINYNESLNTLRYAYNAKQIVNTVKVNEDPNDKIIRVLRDEIEALRGQLKGGGNYTASELKQLKDEIAQREELMREKEKSWEQKIEESKNINKEVQEQMKQEMALRQAEFRKKLELMNKENMSLQQEMDQVKNLLSDKELQKQKELDDELTRAKEDYERKQSEFEKGRIVETAINLQEYYEKKLESMRQQYEDKINSKNQQDSQSALHEIEKLKQNNLSLKEDLNKNQRDLQIQMRQFTNDRAVLGKQIQQLQSKIHTLEQDMKDPNLKKTPSDMGEEIAKKNQEYLSIKQKRDDEEKRYATLQHECKALNDRIETNKAKLDALNEKHSTIVSEIHTNTTILNTLKNEYKQLYEKFEADKTEYNLLLLKKEELHTEITTLKTDLDLHVTSIKQTLKNPTIEDLLKIKDGFNNIFSKLKPLN